MKRLYALVCGLLVLVPILASAQWRSTGPYGGNARTLAFDPKYPDHVLLGAAAGALFESLDGGRNWRYFAHLGSGNEMMLETIAFDPQDSHTIYVAGWNVSGTGGGFFVTRDGGRSWREPADLKGKSIQALSLAESDPRIMVAGALDGLFRSKDSGETWERISPEKHPDLKNFESVVIDPLRPNIIYAGTWHLPWKTTDGGETWSNIKQGVIDDSDVFSIILDRSNTQTVFASACSGIYKSENGGQFFHKVQGIPGTARRTRILQQDPTDPKTVYAGTTEGLFKTVDAGKTFQRITPTDYILNDVVVDPRNPRRLLIATDRGGVYSSDDAGATFQPSNNGFSERQITSIVADPKDPADLYAGVLNDKEFGGVFHSHNGLWKQMSEGLEGSDVFDLGVSEKGQLAAATNRGLFLFDPKADRWKPSRKVVSVSAAPKSKQGRGKNAKLVKASRQTPAIVSTVFTGRVLSLALGDHRWYAATDTGVLHSDNEGLSWSVGPAQPEKSFYSVSAHDQFVAASSLEKIWYSSDSGEHWTARPLPSWVTRVYSVTVTSKDEIWASTRNGALRWTGKSPEEGEWERVLNGLPVREVTSIREEGGLLLAAVAGSKTVYASRDHGQSWEAEPTASFEVTGAVMQGDTLYVTTRHHGVLVREPEVAVSGGSH